MIRSAVRALRRSYGLFDRLFAFERSFGDSKATPLPRLGLTTLEDRLVPDGRPFPMPTLFAGSGSGDTPLVRGYDAETGKLNFSAAPFGNNFSGGNTVASADFNYDGYPDALIGAGPGGGPRVRILDGKTGEGISSPVSDFWAYEQNFTGGVQVAAGDIDGDHRMDVITAVNSGGGPRVKVFSGKTGEVIADFFAFESNFTGGVRLATGDFNVDGKDEIVVAAGAGGGPRVRILQASGETLTHRLSDYFAFSEQNASGVQIAVGDVNGDTLPDIIAGSGNGQVRVFNGRDGTTMADRMAFGTNNTTSVRVSTAYINDDGYADVVVATGSGGNQVKVFGGGTDRLAGMPLDNFAPFTTAEGGVTIAAANDPGVQSIIMGYPDINPGRDLIRGQQFEISIPITGDSLRVPPTGFVNFYARDWNDAKAELIPLGPGTLVGISGDTAVAKLIVRDVPLPDLEYTILADYSGDPNFVVGNSELQTTPLTITNPMEVPVSTPYDNTTCGTDSQVNPAAGTGTMAMASLGAGGVRLLDGTINVARNDLQSAGFGTPWMQSWAWTNARSVADGGAGVSTRSSDVPYLIMANGIDESSIAVVIDSRVQFFDKINGDYVSRFAEDFRLVLDTSGKDDVYRFDDGRGNQFVFKDFDSSPEEGKMIQYLDPQGFETNVLSFNGDGFPEEIVRKEGSGGSALNESWRYTYVSGGDNDGLVESVTLRRQIGEDTWTPEHTVRKVEYAYYEDGENYGVPGDLKFATLKDGDDATIDTSFYQYYTDALGDGYEHALMFAYGPRAYERLAEETYSIEPDPDDLAPEDLLPYADHYLEYDSEQRVTVHRVAGEGCSSCSGGQGEYTYTYDVNPEYIGGGANTWAYKTTETLLDGGVNTVFMNGSGQVMLWGANEVGEDITNYQFQRFNTRGEVILAAAPSALDSDAILEDGGAYLDLVGENDDLSFALLLNNAGLVTLYDYASETAATTSVPGDVEGYLIGTSLRRGNYGDVIPQNSMVYIAHTVGSQDHFYPAAVSQYRDEAGLEDQTTEYEYSWHEVLSVETAQVESITTKMAMVTAAQNGPDANTSTITFFDVYGRPAMTQDQVGVISSTAYDTLTGGVRRVIEDVDTTETGDFDNVAGWTSTGTPSDHLHLISDYEVDLLGRTTKSVSPNGREDYTIYFDPAHEVRFYSGWTGTATTGPITIVREDRAQGYRETITISAVADEDGGRPTGLETFTIGNIETLSRSFQNEAGQTVSLEEYFSFAGMTYTTDADLGGVQNTNYLKTQYGYSLHNGERNKVVSPSGTIYRTEFDTLGRPVSEWVGLDDIPTTVDYWTVGYAEETDMTMVRSYEYDGGGVGDSNVTTMTEFPGGDFDDRVTGNYYDWRNRLVAVKQGLESSEDTEVNRPIFYIEYDNLNRVIGQRRYDGDDEDVTTTDGVPDLPTSTLLRAYTVNSFDNLNRPYRTETYSVDPGDGTLSTYKLATDVWYDERGNVIKSSSPGGLVQKTAYDFISRPVVSSLTDGGSDADWTDADDVTDDNVLEQHEAEYDPDGNVIKSISRLRFHDETTTGALGTASTGVLARVSYQGFYYDLADRLVTSLDVGTNGGTAWTREADKDDSANDRSDDVLRTDITYDDAGRVFEVLDATLPYGRVAQTLYDALGRTTETVENYVPLSDPPPGPPPPPPPSDQNKRTLYTYGPAGMTSMTAKNDGTPEQTTQWVYGVYKAEYWYWDKVSSNDLVQAVYYPDPTTGLPGGAGRVEGYRLNALGQPFLYSDNDRLRVLDYDVLGRQISDGVFAAELGTDISVRQLMTAYDGQGNPFKFTSYQYYGPGTIVNQVVREFNGLGQLTTEYQEHNGAVDPDTSLRVGYTYNEMDGGANNSRLETMSYPFATSPSSPPKKVLAYGYGSGYNEAISRLDSISDGDGTLETYNYLGLGTVVTRSHPLPPTGSPPVTPSLDLTYLTSSPGDAGDQYGGLDRFGRIVDQHWLVDDGSPVTVDQFQYSYDTNGNRLTRVNTTDGKYDFDETYDYDGLNQIVSFARDSHTLAWNYDLLGNWNSVTTDGGSPDEREHNAQNEITSIDSGIVTPVYDDNGNMITDETNKDYVYDSWNRLVEVKDTSNATIARYEYDALGRRVEETESTTKDLYYSSEWQVIEERDTSRTNDVVQQYVWSPVYVDAMILRDRDTGDDGVLDQRLWPTTDANFNVTALVDGNGDVVERYAYDPFGKVTYLSDDYATDLGSSGVDWSNTFQGGRQSDASGLVDFRIRQESVTMGRWTTNDPIKYEYGLNLYSFVGNAPARFTDPLGLAPTITAGGPRPTNAKWGDYYLYDVFIESSFERWDMSSKPRITNENNQCAIIIPMEVISRVEHWVYTDQYLSKRLSVQSTYDLIGQYTELMNKIATTQVFLAGYQADLAAHIAAGPKPRIILGVNIGPTPGTKMEWEYERLELQAKVDKHKSRLAELMKQEVDLATQMWFGGLEWKFLEPIS